MGRKLAGAVYTIMGLNIGWGVDLWRLRGDDCNLSASCWSWSVFLMAGRIAGRMAGGIAGGWRRSCAYPTLARHWGRYLRDAAAGWRLRGDDCNLSAICCFFFLNYGMLGVVFYRYGSWHWGYPTFTRHSSNGVLAPDIHPTLKKGGIQPHYGPVPRK